LALTLPLTNIVVRLCYLSSFTIKMKQWLDVLWEHIEKKITSTRALLELAISLSPSMSMGCAKP
jgi:hypothetical protein